ncbi:NUDIX domain-containing protein [Kribbella speibonae]|uniref:NUDIX domain-containing protein n=1 Tax=Kribbella speibonae TaxID=1572660 RepID=A0ABY2AA98_9ACTN|nr:NUDIX domain-containing protein [Kribbella speibonae]TCC26632.1 NUDIX domain-containing protein [Kribbella speibonae]
MAPEPQHHFGVYARIRDGNHILLVHKTRGPYTGLLDLPGGTPEPGESWQETLERELQEELGLHLPAVGRFKPFTIHVRTTSTGASINFHHRGVFLDLPRPPTAPSTSMSPDTAGSRWFNTRTDNKTHLSPVVHAVLSL